MDKTKEFSTEYFCVACKGRKIQMVQKLFKFYFATWARLIAK